MRKMRILLPLLLLTLTFAACKTGQSVSTPNASNAEVSKSDPIKSPSSRTPDHVGVWRVSEISDFKFSDPELAKRIDEVKAGILANLRMELRADSTYTITGFDGTNNGRYTFMGKEMRHTSEEGTVDTFIFSDIRFGEMKCHFNNAEGASGNITFSRLQ